MRVAAGGSAQPRVKADARHSRAKGVMAENKPKKFIEC